MAKTKAPAKDFETTIAAAYAAQGTTLDLGKGMLDGTVASTAVFQVPLRMMNRHGLIAGATDGGAQEGRQGGRRRCGRGGRLPQVDVRPSALARGRPRPFRPTLESAEVAR
jgi:hypothetical protein